MKHYTLEDGQRVTLDDSKPIGAGGEGSVYKLHKNPDVLAKIYLKRALDRMPDIEDKIKAMVLQKPGLLSYKGLTIIAWPTHVLYDENKHFAGYLMSRVQAKNQLSHVITPTLQKKKFPNITYYDRIVISINLALVMSYLHQNATVIGDINTSDFFVYPGFEIGLVDTDSFQVKVPNKLFHCKVFTPDYTPPEVIEAKKKTSAEVVRLPNHDNYGLAILIFQILNAGVHPFSARVKNKSNFDGNAINYCMEHEIFPYLGKDPHVIPPKNAMPFRYFPKEIQDLFIKAFLPYKQNTPRPTAEEWVNGLRSLKENSKKCRRNKAHYYPNHFSRCPHCERERTKDYDHLVEYFKVISKNYVLYQTVDSKSIKVDLGSVYQDTITSKVYMTKKRFEQALIFHPKMLEKYELANRAKAYKTELNKPNLYPYLTLPLRFLMVDDQIVGYTIKKRPPLYRLVTVLQQAKIGKVKLTDKAKVKIARKIAYMFRELERYHLTCEIGQIYLDGSLKPFLPDLVMLGSSQLSYPRLPMVNDHYRPLEYYLDKVYKQYEEKQKALMLERERIETLKREEEEKRQKLEEARLEKARLEALEREEVTHDSQETSSETVYQVDKDIATNEGKEDANSNDHFAFETSHATSKPEVKEEKVIAPPKVVFVEDAKATIRFHLGIIIHTLLHRVHPFQGTYKGTKKSPSYFIESNVYLQESTENASVLDEQAVLTFGYPKYYQARMRKSLYVKDPNKIKRPSPSAWIRTLTLLSLDLQKCSVSEYHYYHKSLAKCPVCFEKEAKGHDAMRQFLYAYKTNVIDRFTSLNGFFNQVIVIALMLYSLYLLHSNQYAEIVSRLMNIDFVGKWEVLKNAMYFDVLVRYIESGVNTLVKWYELIFGGAGNA